MDMATSLLTLDESFDEALEHLCHHCGVPEMASLANNQDIIARSSVLPPPSSIFSATLDKILESRVSIEQARGWKDQLWGALAKAVGRGEGEVSELRASKDSGTIRQIAEAYKAHVHQDTSLNFGAKRKGFLLSICCLFLDDKREDTNSDLVAFLTQQSAEEFCSTDKKKNVNGLVLAEGVGEATLQVVAIRARRDPNIFPRSDQLIKDFVKKVGLSVPDLEDKVSPFSSVAALLIWRERELEKEGGKRGLGGAKEGAGAAKKRRK